MKSKDSYNRLKNMVKFVSTIISWTALLILVIVAGFLAYYVIGGKVAEKTGGTFEPIISLYTIVSPSMSPNINVYDVVVTKRVKSADEIKVNDVITFISTSSISRGMTITHRVIDIGTDENGVTYKTKGDNNLSPDSSPAKYDNVIGKVILRIPGLGRVQSLLANRAGWLIAIVIPALFIIVSDILKILKLTGVKNKIEKMDESEKASIESKKIKEKERKEEIKQRLNIEEDTINASNNEQVVENIEIKNNKSKKKIVEDNSSDSNKVDLIVQESTELEKPKLKEENKPNDLIDKDYKKPNSSSKNKNYNQKNRQNNYKKNRKKR